MPVLLDIEKIPQKIALPNQSFMRSWSKDVDPLAKAIESFVLMYRNHAAREDTVVFPAWKKSLTAKRYNEMGEKFEEIEHQQFGEDGFSKAVREISDIEKALGFSDLSHFTAPPPPAR